jgi:hypothetical protein
MNPSVGAWLKRLYLYIPEPAGVTLEAENRILRILPQYSGLSVSGTSKLCNTYADSLGCLFMLLFTGRRASESTIMNFRQVKFPGLRNRWVPISLGQKAVTPKRRQNSMHLRHRQRSCQKVRCPLTGRQGGGLVEFSSISVSPEMSTHYDASAIYA